ncbi:MAG TPA: carboxyl transferase domain-containing protein, partial [Acidimicrobiales bacterium]
EDVADALEIVGEILSFLPANSLEVPPLTPTLDPADRGCGNVAVIVPSNERASYDVREVIAEIVDDGGFVELRERFAASLVVGLARISGMPVGIVANQPSQLAGALDIESSLKGARFVRWCDSFNLPLVTLVDTPGVRPGRDQEWRGIVRHGAKLAFAYAEATVPRVSIVLRKAYGGAYIVMDCKAMGNDCALAWPSAEIAVMGAKGGVEIVHRKALLAMADDQRDLQRAELEAEYAAEHLSPRVAAERGFIDEVIDPATTRLAVAEALMALAAKREPTVRRRHDNIPL